MVRVFLLGFRHPLIVLLAAAAVTVVSLRYAGDVQVDVSTDVLVAQGSDEQSELEELRARYGGDDVAAVFVRDENLFSPSRLPKLQELNDALAALPFISKIEGICTIGDLRDADGALNYSPVISPPFPVDPDEALSRRSELLLNPILAGSVISTAGDATLLILKLRDGATEDRTTSAQIDQVLARFEGQFEKMFQLGEPRVHEAILALLRKDLVRLLPATVLILLVVLAVAQRSILAGVLPLVCAALAICWLLGIMAVVGIPFTLLNYVLPMLVLVVGAAEDTHLVHEFTKSLREDRDIMSAYHGAADRFATALTLTASTTLLGFASTALSNLPILRNFGFAAVIGLALRFSCTALVLPAMLRLCVRHFARASEHETSDRFSAWIARVVMRYAVPRPIAMICLVVVVTAAALLGAVRVTTNNDLLSFLDPQSPVVENQRECAEVLAGLETISVSIQGKHESFLLPQELRSLRTLSEGIAAVEGVDAVTSFADIIARMHQQLKGGNAEDFRVPDSVAAVRQMLLFVNAGEFSEYVTPDFSGVQLRVRTHLTDSGAINRLRSEIEGLLRESDFANQPYSVTGGSVVVAAAVNDIVATQVWSLGATATIMFLVVTAMFLSVRCGLVNLVINLFGVVTVFGVMGFFGVSLNAGTCMVAAITLGIAVNDTMHLLVRFNREARRLKSEYSGIESSIRNEARPIVSSSLAVAAGFAMLSFSSFLPVRQFGLLSAGVLLISTLIDLVVTPVFFANTRIVTLWDMLGLHVRRSLIRSSPFFRGLNAWQAKKVILATRMEDFGAGEKILSMGDDGDSMYVIVSGQVEVWREDPDTPRFSLIFGPGAVFGEVALVCGGQRTANVTALEKSSVLILNQDSLRAFSRFAPYLATQLFLNIANILGERLAARNEWVAGTAASTTGHQIAPG